MARRLHPDESALWAQVAASVRPLPGRVRPIVGPAPRVIVDQPPPAPPPPKRAPAANRIAVDAATLDGGWDRKMRSGRLAPDLTVDLHGYTRDRAHALLTRMIVEAATGGARIMLVITGKGARDSDDIANNFGRPRGVIRASLRDWLQSSDLRPYIAALRPAHPRHGGGGAWYVILRR
ncbi:Smr/MutS family protein [Glacieibacterium megasporae]|uniref:Smr/MutS family protein n=1 Tax=Glacieibacterium megasporae TaxID=2835787 RepID=UPI001C1E077B|nr:Smr/MutS family protein [Polymorphobacter megasporae]UAJ10730.1 Smr/MutS family protein [Polymorphobacter megasporae]